MQSIFAVYNRILEKVTNFTAVLAGIRLGDVYKRQAHGRLYHLHDFYSHFLLYIGPNGLYIL